MDWSENRDIILMFAILGWTMMGNIVFAGHQEIARINAPVSYGAMIALILFTDWYSTYAASQYTAIRATIYPGQSNESFFLNKDAKGQTFKLPNFPNWFVSTYPLAVKKKHKDSPTGEINRLALIHEGNIQDRLVEGKIKVNYKGTIVTHHGGCAVSVEVPEQEFQPIVYDQGEVTLCYFLGYGSGDTGIISMEQRMTQSLFGANPLPKMNPNTNEYVRELLRRFRILQQGYLSLSKKYAQVSANASEYQTQSIQKGGRLETMGRHITGLLKIVPYNRSAIIDYVQTWVLARGDIRSLGKATSLFGRIPKWIIYPIMAFGVLAFLSVNPDFASGFGQWISIAGNQLFMVLILGIVSVIVYYVFHRRSSGK